MRELAILTFVTLDGVMQGPTSPEEDASGGFVRGGWAAPYWDEVMEQVRREAMATPYDFLFGRKTYELFAGSGQTTREMDDATKYVVTSTLDRLEWSNSNRITGDVAAEVGRLKEEEGPLLQVHGSWQLIQTLLAHGLVDEFRLWIFPVVVGSGGKRLFDSEIDPTELTLIKTDACANGVMMGIYRRAGSG